MNKISNSFKNTFKIVLINYANELFQKSQKINNKTGKSVGLFDEVISYSPKDIDIEFRTKNEEILIQKRGGGYWLWKPYFIKKALNRLSPGDFLFYCDSGCYFTDSIEDLIELSLEKRMDVVPFELSHIEADYTKRDAFVLMNCDSEEYYAGKQRLASFILFRKSDFSIKLVDEWFAFAQDKRILTDLENQCGLGNYPDYKEHRHDQSIFSLLTKKYGLKAFKDPSQYGSIMKELYPDSTYNQFLFQTRKRNYPLYIELKKYLSRKKAIIKRLFNFKY